MYSTLYLLLKIIIKMCLIVTIYIRPLVLERKSTVFTRYKIDIKTT